MSWEYITFGVPLWLPMSLFRISRLHCVHVHARLLWHTLLHLLHGCSQWIGISRRITCTDFVDVDRYFAFLPLPTLVSACLGACNLYFDVSQYYMVWSFEIRLEAWHMPTNWSAEILFAPLHLSELDLVHAIVNFGLHPLVPYQNYSTTTSFALFISLPCIFPYTACMTIAADTTQSQRLSCHYGWSTSVQGCHSKHWAAIIMKLLMLSCSYLHTRTRLIHTRTGISVFLQLWLKGGMVWGRHPLHARSFCRVECLHLGFSNWVLCVRSDLALVLTRLLSVVLTHDERCAWRIPYRVCTYLTLPLGSWIGCLLNIAILEISPVAWHFQ